MIQNSVQDEYKWLLHCPFLMPSLVYLYFDELSYQNGDDVYKISYDDATF